MEVGVSYFIGANHRGNGYAAEALKCFVEYLFAKYHLNIKILCHGSAFLSMNPCFVFSRAPVIGSLPAGINSIITPELWESILIQQVYAGHRSITWSVWTDGLRKSEE